MIAELARRFDASFPETVGWRTVGREAEHPVVNPDGTAGEVERLWPHLMTGMHVSKEGDLVTALDGEHWSYALEVGRGTIEIICAPRADLHELRDVYEPARDRLLEACQREGFLLLGYGIQPVTPATPEFMSKKQRYGVLLDVLGDVWLWFALTASDQFHARAARHEWVGLANTCNLLAPFVVALTANSPIFAGRPSGFMSAREGTMGEIGAEVQRHGMPASPVRDARDHVGRLASLRYLMAQRDGKRVPMQGRFDEWVSSLADADQAWLDFLHHEHYVWHCARPRSAHGTVELRSACQQPPNEHMAAAALSLGMICAAPRLAEIVVSQLGPDPWPAMRDWHRHAIAQGLEAPPPGDGLLHALLDAMEAALVERGRGEEEFLAPLRARVDARQSPAQRAVRAFERGGISALLEATAIR